MLRTGLLGIFAESSTLYSESPSRIVSRKDGYWTEAGRVNNGYRMIPEAVLENGEIGLGRATFDGQIDFAHFDSVFSHATTSPAAEGSGIEGSFSPAR